MLVQCQKCSTQIKVTERLFGRKVKCKCGVVMRMPQNPAGASSPAMSKAPSLAPSPSMAPSAVAPPPVDIQFQCPKCHQRLSVPTSAAGQVTQCPCSAKIRVPDAPSNDPFALPNDLPPSGLEPLDDLEEVGLEPIDDDPLAGGDLPGLAPLDNPGFASANANPYGSPTSTPSYLQSSKPASGGGKRKVKRKVKKRDNSGGTSGVSVGGQVLSGLGTMAFGALLLFGGLAVGRIFFLAPILIIIGFVTMIRGLINPD